MSYVFGSIFNYLKENGNSIREKMFASQSPILNEVSLLIEGMWNNLPGGHIDLPERIAAVDGGLLRYRLDNAALFK